MRSDVVESASAVDIGGLEEGGIVLWLVDLVADELEQFLEGVLIRFPLDSLRQIEVNFGEVHAERLWHNALEQLVSKVELDTISFVGSGGLEVSRVDSIDVEGDPVLGLVLLVEEVGMNVRVD